MEAKEPPKKKRRFFQPSTEEPSPTPPAPAPPSSCLAFDQEAFESFVGTKVSPETVDLIRRRCGDDLQRAVNYYLDRLHEPEAGPRNNSQRGHVKHPTTPALKPAATSPPRPRAPSPPGRLRQAPDSRYIGSLGVEGWATRSGTGIIQHGDVVRIERQKIQPLPPPPQKAKNRLAARVATAASRRVDVIVRFSSQSGSEIGRLAKDAADWVSTLIDQKICAFEAVCVYAPERLRTNDTIFLQLRCSLLRSAFQSASLNPDDDQPDRYFSHLETASEKALRLRQVALVKLLHEINLQPTTADAAVKDKRSRLLQAAELDEKKQREVKEVKEAKTLSAGKGSGSSPPCSSDNEQEEGLELEQDQLDALYKKAQCFDFNTPEAEPAESFAMTLKPYQKQSLHWMMAKEKDEKGDGEPSMHPLWEEYTWPTKDADEQELPQVDGQSSFYVNLFSGDLSLDFPVQEQHCLGGILADEMGLGKTIQILSLVHSHKSDVACHSPLSRPDDFSPQALPLWPKRESAERATAPHTTLVVAPTSLLAQWQSEAERASKPGSLQVELYYGGDKTNNLRALCSGPRAPGLVITSYGIVLSEFMSMSTAKKEDKAAQKGLFSLRFFRLVLDEAHHIKNRASKTARACHELAAAHRWALTGTPIVNRLEDLFSLVRFLGVEPWNSFPFWKAFITVPFESGDFVRALSVVQTVLEPLVMRRTKKMQTPDGKPLVPLPPKRVEIVEVELSPTERDVYDYIFAKARRTFTKSVEAGTVLKSYTTIFAQILRLRQCCCHPTLVRNRDIVADEEEAAAAAADAAAGLADDMDLETLVARFQAATEADRRHQGSSCVFGAHALDEIRREADLECPLCFEAPMAQQTVTGACWHSACRQCLVDYLKHETDRGRVARCFNCRQPISQRDLFEVVRHEDEAAPAGKTRISLQRLGANDSSAKVAALLKQLQTLRREHPAMKSVVFSQFTSFLSLLEPVLARAGIRFLRLDGAMAQRARAAVLADFAAARGFVVLVASLRAGGVGLNLTAAARVFLLDPWWSFAVEAQAIDRVHRLGQDASVVVQRFIVKNSLEEGMLRIQERKKLITSSLGMMSDEEKKLQRIEDIKELLEGTDARKRPRRVLGPLPDDPS